MSRERMIGFDTGFHSSPYLVGSGPKVALAVIVLNAWVAEREDKDDRWDTRGVLAMLRMWFGVEATAILETLHKECWIEEVKPGFVRLIGFNAQLVDL